MIKKILKKNGMFLATHSFEELYSVALKVKNTINKYTEFDKVAIIGNKSFQCYASILGSVYADKTFIPINPSSGIERIKYILEISGIDTVVICEESHSLSNKLVGYKKIFFDNLENKEILNNTQSKYVYIMFTSGSTGRPKGVPISKKNLLSYLNYVIQKFNITENDKISQTFDISFDLSMHDIFISFFTGATLYPLLKTELLMSHKFIEKYNLTIWFSVPSVAIIMDRLKLLNNNRNSSLRLSIFCGESFPTYIAKKWSQYAINSEIYNLYGPTETTIAISYYKFKGNEKTNILPIGKIFNGNEYKILNDELCLFGEQVFNGYIGTDNEPFILIEEKKYYKTGDIVKEENDILYFINRKDFDIKIRGYRVNILEIESLIKEKFNIDSVCIPKIKNNKVERLVLFTTKDDIVLDEYFPDYMIPEFIKIETLKLNQNGKIDRGYYFKRINK